MLNLIMRLYKNNDFFTKLHVFLRYHTCPLLVIEKFVPPQGLVIDYGCGHGVFSHVLSLTAPHRRIYAVDVSEAKVRAAKKTIINNGEIIFSSDVNIEKVLEEADCLVMLDVLCYSSEKEIKQKLSSYFNHMRTGTRLIIKDIQRLNSAKYFWLYVQEFIFVKLLRRTQAASMNFFTKIHMMNLLRDLGFKVEAHDLSRGYAYPHILYLCWKE